MIKIFINITSYLRENVIHIRIVLATPFMAVAYGLAVVKYASLESHDQL